ncbi:MAG: DEAD/DEAH box helicase [Desulfamplus sp.]|nr:DEAD/DEAH box helicase [Desulfamplus sp.]
MPFDSPLFKLPNTFRAFYGAFSELHAAQREAISPILEGKDLILQSATGSGKSEAVLAPCIERVIQSNRQFTLLYIIPTRALAVDLKRRFESVITERLGLNLSIRTGDVKQRGGKPPDIMFTTPESLDVMLGSTNEAIRAFLNSVRCVIIDEVHPLIYTYRGVHLAHLLTRLERRNGCSIKSVERIQRIAISATIADINNIINAFNFRPIPDTCHIKTTVKREIKARLVYLKNEAIEFPAFLNDLHDTWGYNKILLFTNSRGACDRLFGIINRTGRFKGVSELHYSNLKPAERKQTEKRFRTNSRALCIATSTLELGIDVGDVDAVILYEPPDSVSAFLQRIGRANRREKTLNFWGICQGELASMQVVRFLALLNLARQGIIESPTPKILPSVMAQQIISCLYEKKQISLPAILDLFQNRTTNLHLQETDFLSRTDATLSEMVLTTLFQSLEKKSWIKKSLVSGLYSGGFQYGKHLKEYKIWGNFPEEDESYTLELTTHNTHLAQFSTSKTHHIEPALASKSDINSSKSDIIRSIADIPASIVKQIDVGNRIDIAGKRIKIISINHDAKRVLAIPANSKPDKEILWLGMGAHVSFEVAQMMRHILKINIETDTDVKTSADAENQTDTIPNTKVYDPSLLSRTRTLFESELHKEKQVVILDNGIEVVYGRRCLYYYRTYLGSVGNLVLEWCIRNCINNEDLYDLMDDPNTVTAFNNYDITNIEAQNPYADSDMVSDEIYVSSNEIGVECSKFIRFENLILPENRKSFEKWVRVNIKILSSLIPLNLFCKTLPIDLLIKEVSDFFFDQRVIDKFNYYLLHTSEIISGDINVIKNNINAIQDRLLINQSLSSNYFERREDSSEGSTSEYGSSDSNDGSSKQCDLSYIFAITQGISLLEQEKEVWRLNFKSIIAQNSDISFSTPCLETKPNGTITATMVSDYFLHAQCKRRFCFKYLRIPTPASDFKLDREAAIKNGLIHEQNVLKSLRDNGNPIVNMNHQDFLDIIRQLTSKKYDISNESKIFIFQSILKFDAVISEQFKTNIVGVPDLIQISINNDGTNEQTKHIIMEVGDIKSSTKPQYHHKWQVAFYALLLKKIVALHDIKAEVSSRGFLMTRPVNEKQTTEYVNHNAVPDEIAVYEKHSFDLEPFIAAFPMLLETIQSTLSKSVDNADYRLKPHCTSCDWFAHCYSEALEKEDIQFLPGLTDGELLKLRKVGISTIETLHNNLKPPSPAQSPSQERSSRLIYTDFISPDIHSNLNELFSSGEQKKLIGRCDAIINNRIILHKRTTRLFPANLSAYFFIHIIISPISQTPKAFGLLIMDEHFKVVKTHFHLTEKEEENSKFWSILSKAWDSYILRGKGPHIFYFGSRTTLSNVNLSMCSDIKKIFMEHFYMPLAGSVSLFTLAHIFGCNQGVERPSSLFHNYYDYDKTKLESEIKSILITMAELFKKVKPLLESLWINEWGKDFNRPFITTSQIESSESIRAMELHPMPSKSDFLRFISEEKRLKETDTLELQELPLHERMEKFRALGYLIFTHTSMDNQGRGLYVFNTTDKTMPSKFRKSDFLKLVHHGMEDIQNGYSVIISDYNKEAVSLISRSGRLNLSKTLFYSLEEDITDFTEAKLSHAAEFLFSESPFNPANQLITGMWGNKQDQESIKWIQKFITCKNQGISFLNQEITLSNTGLNDSQIAALALPFCYKTSLIQGPPGTGKSHLLAWILIMLVMNAFERGISLRIGVSALTHQAIDNVLNKVVSLVNKWLPLPKKSKFSEESKFSGHPFPASCIKWGKSDNNGELDKCDISDNDNTAAQNGIEVEFSDDADYVLSKTWTIIGATGFGFYNLFNSRSGEFPEALDWIIFDEASQVLLPQALLTLIYGKGNFLFLGDVHQLPPIVVGDYGELNSSILSKLMTLYPESHQVTLDVTYRMNREICEFPSKMWYQERLNPALGNADLRLNINSHHISKRPFHDILDPSKPVVMVIMEHEGCSQQCDMEAELMAAIAHELMEYHGLKSEQIAIISPHRAQNNAILRRLSEMMMSGKDNDLNFTSQNDNFKNQNLNKDKLSLKPERSLPLVDTVERVQGAERDVVIFGITSSDPDHISSEFLNSPNRLNVAMTRARQKLIIVGSKAFFYFIPDNEKMLEKNCCFKELLEYCKRRNVYICVNGVSDGT